MSLSGLLGRAVLAGGTVLLVALAPRVLAQDIPRPELNVGDRWTFERTDRTKNVSEGGRESTVMARSETEYTFENKILSSGTTTSAVSDLNLNMVEVSKRRFTPFIPVYAWPLSVGKKWNGSYSGSNETGGAFSGERACEVVAKETIQVKGGSFETFKIACDGKFKTFSSNVQRTLDGYSNSMFWFAPAAKRAVRAEERNGTFSFGVFSNYVEELVSFELKK